MITLERFAFREKYGVSPNRFLHMNEGESISVEYKDQPTKTFTCIKINGTKTCRESMVLSENGEEFLLDLSPHWERDSADIDLCHAGVVNLIKAIYSQTEKDYEEYYLLGQKGYKCERLPGENQKEFAIRQRKLWKDQMDKCEEFLGSVFTTYAKVKALWRITHDVNVIADRVGIEPKHVTMIVDRLGLNRTETAQKETETF